MQKLKNQIFKFLIVEDEIIAQVTKDCLENLGYFVSLLLVFLEKKQLKKLQKLSRLSFNGY